MCVLALLCVALTVGFISAQDSTCDFYQKVQGGGAYLIQSPNYPGNYNKTQTCRWIGVCPTGYNCRLDCSIVQLPESPSCSGDRMLISKTGDPFLIGATAVCGKSPFTVVSTAEILSIGMIMTSTSPGGKFSCRLYAQSATSQPPCTCGERKQNRIVGGQETGVNEFRMMAAIVRRDTERVKCGATIISPRHVGTAAHCIDTDIVSQAFVLVGDHKLSSGADTNTTAGYRIETYYIHPQYNKSNYDKDIAIVVTTIDIQFNYGVGPACLPFKYVGANLIGVKLTILGWGTLFIGGPNSDTLQKVDVDVISPERCSSYVPGVTSSQICTLTPGKDACQMDSGGPLLLVDSSTGYLIWIGVVSFGQSCGGNEPGVHTEITGAGGEVLDWIVSVTGYNFCKK